MLEEKIMISGPVGHLEAIVTKPQIGLIKHVAIICHPHPLHEGTMHNKVVTTIAKAFMNKHYATVRFNFRGVGKSEGTYGEIKGEVEDALAVYQWVQDHFPQADISLAGFSFGAFVSASVANQKPCLQLMSIAPAVNHADFSSLNNVQCPWLVLQGEQDEIVPCKQVRQFVESASEKIHLVVFPETSHFFHGKLIELREKLLEWILPEA